MAPRFGSVCSSPYLPLFFGGAAARRLPDRPSLRRYEPDQVRRDSRTVAISALFIQGAPGTLQVCAASGRSQATNAGRTPVRDLALGPLLGSNAAGWEKNAAKATERGTPRSDARRHLRARRAALSACVAGGALADRSTASVGTRACKGDGSSRRSQSAGRRSGARSRHGGHYGGARRTRRRTRAADTGRSRSAILRASEGTLSRRACACRRRVRSAADAARAWSGSDRRRGVGASAAHSETRKETTPAAAVSAARSARKRLRAIHLFLPVADTDRPFDRDRGFSD